MPGIAYGTWTLGNGQGPIDQIAQAFDTGYHHIGKNLEVANNRYEVLRISQIPLRGTETRARWV